MKILKKLTAVFLVGALVLCMLTACTGSKTQTTTEKAAELTNIFLKGEGINTSVKADSTLDKNASDYAAILKQYVAVPAGTTEETAQVQANYAVNDKRSVMDNSFNSSKKYIWLVGKYDRLTANDYDEDGTPHSNTVAVTDERIAQSLVYNLNWLLTPAGTDGKSADDPVATELIGIGVAKVSDINVPDGLEDHSTRKFTGWVVVISYK